MADWTYAVGRAGTDTPTEVDPHRIMRAAAFKCWITLLMICSATVLFTLFGLTWSMAARGIGPTGTWVSLLLRLVFFFVPVYIVIRVVRLLNRR